MTKLIISYNKYHHNWYVGELYEYFVKYMQDNLNIQINIISMEDFASQYNEPNEIRPTGTPSLFNIYNLIVYNTDKNIGFLHSLSDYAPVMLEHSSAIEKLNIKAFAFSSNFISNLYSIYAHLDIKLIPSFYILENWDDYNLIELQFLLSNQNNKINKCYFNGLSYGHRSSYINNLSKNTFFDFRDKRNNISYRDKKSYYQELSQHIYGLSLNGAAQICYRDLECFGLGVLCLREPMDILTVDQLTPNKHYKIVLDDFIRNNIFDPDKADLVAEQFINNINVISIEEKQYILHNARQWFVNNVHKDNQIKFLYQCLIENNII